MSSEVAALSALVWVTLAILGGLYLVQRSPRRRKPVDELEAADAALRNRIVDLEDKFEHHVKREAVRAGRDRAESAAQGQLDFGGAGGGDRLSRLQALRARMSTRRKEG